MKDTSFFFFLSLLFTPSDALIEWPFHNKPTYLMVNLTVGSQAQLLSAYLRIGEGDPGLFLLSNAKNSEGFDVKRSSSFSKIRDYNKEGFITTGLVGTDTVVIPSKQGKKQTVKNVPLSVLDDRYGHLARLHLGHSDNGQTFLEQLVKREREQVAVLTYDNIPSDEDNKFSGLLTLGGKPQICSKQWTMLNEMKVENGKQWSFRVDSLTVGRFSHTRPFNASFVFDSNGFHMWSNIFYYIRDELGMDEDYLLPCNLNKKIQFKIGRKTLSLEGKDYLTEESEEKKGWCEFRGRHMPEDWNQTKENVFLLPMTLLRDQCFLFDFKNKRVGLADKLKKG